MTGLADADPGRHGLLQRAVVLSVLSIATGAVVGISAVVAALASGSLSLLGFGFDAAIDSAASVVLVWRFRIEREHPHRAARVEHVAEVGVGAVFLVLGAYLAVNALLALAANRHPAASPVGEALTVFSLIALPPLAYAKYRTATKLQSRALRADSLLTGLAALLALIGLVGLGLSSAFGVGSADAIGALIVSAIIAREGWAGVRSRPVDDIT